MKMVSLLALAVTVLTGQGALAQTPTDLDVSPLAENIATPPAEPTVTPFELVFLGYQGKLKEQGISSYQSFCFEYTQGKITPKILAAAAVKAGYLGLKESTDENYLGYLLLQIRSFCKR